MQRFYFFTILLLQMASIYGQKATIHLQTSRVSPPATVTDQFTNYTLYELDHEPLYKLWKSPKDLIEFELRTDQEVLDFELARYDLRAANYSLRSGPRTDADSKAHPRLPAAQFKGLLTSDLTSTSIFTVDSSYVLGYWKHQGGKEYFLEPLWKIWPEAPRDVYIYYRADQVKPGDGVCGVSAEDRHEEMPQNVTKSVTGGCLEVELTIAGDFELFQIHGSVAATENFMLNTLALVQLTYDSQPGDDEFDDELRFLVVNTFIADSEANDPWTNSTASQTLLTDFAIWGNTAGNLDNPHDIASLWTGRNLDGATVGRAFIATTCGAARYNINQDNFILSTFTRTLWAHELGHNLGSDHDPAASNFIMTPSTTSTTVWSDQSRTAINDHYQSVFCLSPCGVPPNADFTVVSNDICPGSALVFTSLIDEDIDTYSWSFPGGTPSSSTEANPTVTYNTPGNFVATLTAANGSGSSTSQQNISVALGQTSILFFDNFESGTLDNFTLDNPDFANTWEIDFALGNGGEQAALMANFVYQAPGESDGLLLPLQDFSDVTSARLEFEYAYVRFEPGGQDQLRVLVTADGVTEELFFGDEDGSMNFATGPDNMDFFRPLMAEDWCFNGPSCIDLDLSQYDGQSDVQITIENINGFGNNLYVDNILVSATCAAAVLPVEWLAFEATPAKEHAVLNWAVNQDELHAGFVVERSNALTPDRWTEMGYIVGQGAAVANASYQFLDYEVAGDQTYFYRLRQQDANGQESLSVIRSVRFGQIERTSSLYPNPTNGQMSLISAGGGSGNYQILDARGRKLMGASLTGTRTELDLTSLPTGLYFVRVTQANQETETLRVIRR